jgi:hypothetical protein
VSASADDEIPAEIVAHEVGDPLQDALMRSKTATAVLLASLTVGLIGVPYAGGGLAFDVATLLIGHGPAVVLATFVLNAVGCGLLARALREVEERASDAAAVASASAAWKAAALCALLPVAHPALWFFFFRALAGIANSTRLTAERARLLRRAYLWPAFTLVPLTMVVVLLSAWGSTHELVLRRQEAWLDGRRRLRQQRAQRLAEIQSPVDGLSFG